VHQRRPRGLGRLADDATDQVGQAVQRGRGQVLQPRDAAGVRRAEAQDGRVAVGGQGDDRDRAPDGLFDHIMGAAPATSGQAVPHGDQDIAVIQ